MAVAAAAELAADTTNAEVKPAEVSQTAETLAEAATMKKAVADAAAAPPMENPLAGFSAASSETPAAVEAAEMPVEEITSQRKSATAPRRAGQKKSTGVSDWSSLGNRFESFSFRESVRNCMPLPLPEPPAHVTQIASFETLVDPGGITNVGVQLHKKLPAAKIGTMVAGNSGRPGGACGLPDGTARSLHAEHGTQEEDVVSNWLITEVANAGEVVGSSGNVHASRIYANTISGKWGMLHPESDDVSTVQQVDYTQANGGYFYADAWVVKEAQLSAKEGGGKCNHGKGKGGKGGKGGPGTQCYTCGHRGHTAANCPQCEGWPKAPQGGKGMPPGFSNPYGKAQPKGKGKAKGKKKYNTRRQYPTALVFVAGPNCGRKPSNPSSTMRRTFNPHMHADYGLFCEGVKAALRAGLHAMANTRCDVALLAHVSAGIYGGPWR